MNVHFFKYLIKIIIIIIIRMILIHKKLLLSSNPNFKKVCKIAKLLILLTMNEIGIIDYTSY